MSALSTSSVSDEHRSQRRTDHPPRPGALAGAARRARRHARAGAGRDGRPGRRADRRAAGIDQGLADRPARPRLRRDWMSPPQRGSLVVTTACCAYLMIVRLFRVSETALADPADAAFRHVHDLSMLHQQSERRGSLVSRVTSDVDQITQFLQWGGVILLVSVGPARGHHRGHGGLLVAAHARGARSCFLPLCPAAPAFQRRLAGGVRRGPRAGRRRCSAPCRECVVGADVIRAYGVAGRTAARSTRRSTGTTGSAQTAGAATAACRSPPASSPPALAIAAVVVVGVLLGVGGELTVGELTAFLFLVTLFVAAGADRHRGAQRGAERGRRLAAGARRARHAARRRRPGRRPASTCRRGRSTSASSDVSLRLPRTGRRGARRRRPAISRRGRGWRSSARPARARRRSPSCSPG